MYTMYSLFLNDNPELQNNIKFEFHFKYLEENYALEVGRSN